MADHLFGITDTGKVRGNNEDVFIAEELMGGQFLLAGVIDGVGGYEGGEVASAIAKETVLAEMEEIGRDVIAQLTIAFNLANEEIIGRKLVDQKLSDMACVATIAVIDQKNNLFHYIHVGDTRLYLYRDSSLVKISQDQSFVGFLEDSGRLTEEVAMLHPKRNEINQALGLTSSEEMADSYFETGSSPFLPGDVILICSDGLTDLVEKAVIASILGSGQDIAEQAAQLIAKANNAGGKDNVTVVLARNVNAAVQHDEAKPVEKKTAPVLTPPAPVRPVEAIVDNGSVSLADSGNAQRGMAADVHRKTADQKYRLPLILLTLACLLLAGLSIWLSRNYFKGIKVEQAIVIAPVPALNAREKLISDTLAKLKGDTLSLSADFFKGQLKDGTKTAVAAGQDTVQQLVVRLSRPLNIDRDTLIIKVADIVFQADSAYKGPAFVLAPGCKYISLNNLVFENFETGILAHQNALELKNTRFNRCKTPVQIAFGFPDGFYTNGRIGKRSFQADSLANK